MLPSSHSRTRPVVVFPRDISYISKSADSGLWSIGRAIGSAAGSRQLPTKDALGRADAHDVQSHDGARKPRKERHAGVRGILQINDVKAIVGGLHVGAVSHGTVHSATLKVDARFGTITDTPEDGVHMPAPSDAERQ